MKISKSLLILLIALVVLGGAGYFIYSSTQRPNTPETQYQLAYRLQFGNGVAKNSKKACELYQSVANKGLAKAQNSLGACYEIGEGIEKDLEQAVYWYKKAAAQDYVFAQMNLGEFYHKNDDFQNAILWYSKAAELGDAKAQSFLGYMYEYGQGTSIDQGKSIEFYRKAAEQGQAEAQYNLGRYYMSEAGGENHREALNWYTKASNQDLPVAHYNLAVMYERGWGVERNFLLAGELYKKAALNGLDKAEMLIKENKVFCLTEEKWSVAKVDSCVLTASAGYPEAQRELAIVYYKGQVVSKNVIEAFAWGTTFLFHKTDTEVDKSFALMTALMLSELDEKEKVQAKEKAKQYVSKYTNLSDF